MNIKKINPKEITVPESRQRKELGDVDDLALSIERLGQIHPIILDDNNTLIVGYRRLLACEKLGRDVEYVVWSDLPSLEKEELELEENIRRKNLTPAEEVLAIKRLLDLRQKREGKASAGRLEGYGIRDLAVDLGVSKSSIAYDIGVAEYLETFPELSALETKESILKEGKRLEEEFLVKEIKTRQVTKPRKPKLADELVLLGNCLDILPTLSKESFDIVCTDPPFGIELGKVRKKKADADAVLAEYGEDTKEEYFSLLEKAIPLIKRVMRRDSHLWMFVDIEHYKDVLLIFKSNGFSYDKIPLLWVKENFPGQTSRPEFLAGRAYEAILFAWLGNMPLSQMGKPNVFRIKPLDHSQKAHPTQKPAVLMMDILLRSCRPGQRVLDPFCGSGSTLIAARKLHLSCLGIEINPVFRNIAISLLAKEV